MSNRLKWNQQRCVPTLSQAGNDNSEEAIWVTR